jgi:hypothetical protein
MYPFIFHIQILKNKLASIKKELQQVKKDNVALSRYINARRKKEEARRKAMVVTPTFDEVQSSKDVRAWMK